MLNIFAHKQNNISILSQKFFIGFLAKLDNSKSFGKNFYLAFWYENFNVTEINHYCVTTRCDINFLNAYFLLPRAYILIFGVKYKKKIFQKNFLSKKFRIPPHTNFGRREKKFLFGFYPIYQNVRTGQLKWRLRKVDITSGCHTIMVYFCNIKIFILMLQK